jgi:hypothetical protein
MFDRKKSKNDELTPELTALEGRLAGLGVAPLHIDRDRLMFEAGRAAGRADRASAATLRVAGAPTWFWPSAAAMMTAACVVLSAMLIWRDDPAFVAQNDAKPQAAEKLKTEIGSAAVERPAVLPDVSKWVVQPAGGYLGKRYVALTRGVGEMRSDSHGGVSLQTGDAARPVTARELLRELVPVRAAHHSNS